MTSTKKKVPIWTIIPVACAVFACICVCMLIITIIEHNRIMAELADVPAYTAPADPMIMDHFDALVGSSVSGAQDGVYGTSRAFWIPEDAEIAPKPRESCYGETTDPASLQWLLDDASELLNGQETVFRTDIQLAPESKVTYYLDQSILVITWQQILDEYVYTFSEVKISHPSQFRRYLAGNEYNSDYVHPVSRMCAATNAVMGASADFYRGRNHGIIVYEGLVRRTDHAEKIDTCFIDRNGDLILVPAGDLMGDEATQQFVDDHDIEFSLAFGPILVQDGKRCEPAKYYLGEINDGYPRAALCQKDKLHYVIVTANGSSGYWNRATLHDFANRIDELGCISAYTLDGGKTATISMRGKAQNPIQRNERWISDMIYFATAIPST